MLTMNYRAFGLLSESAIALVKYLHKKGIRMNTKYVDYLQSEDWIAKRYLKRLKANKCAICGSTSNLHVHHLNYRNLTDVELSDLRVLCKRCHFLAHDLHKAGKYKFKNTNHQSRFAILKAAVKKELNLTNQNMFRS